MPVGRSSLRDLFQYFCFDIRSSRGSVITSSDWCDLPENQGNFVETETSSDKMAWRKFAATYKALSSNDEPQNNTNNDRCRYGDPDSDRAIFLR